MIRYFIRVDGGPTKIDTNDTPKYLQKIIYCRQYCFLYSVFYNAF